MDIQTYIHLRGGRCIVEASSELLVATVKLPLPTDVSVNVEATVQQHKCVSEDDVVFEALTKAQQMLDHLVANLLPKEKIG